MSLFLEMDPEDDASFNLVKAPGILQATDHIKYFFMENFAPIFIQFTKCVLTSSLSCYATAVPSSFLYFFKI